MSLSKLSEVSTASSLTQISFTEEDELSLYGEGDDTSDKSEKKVEELFPIQGVDALNDGTPLDLRSKNSWTARLHEVSESLI